MNVHRLTALVQQSIQQAWRRARDTARLAIGLGDYEAYASHVRAHHPGCEPMDRDTWFRERVAARYGRGRSRCC